MTRGRNQLLERTWKVLESKATAAIAYTKRNNSLGPDGIVVEMIEALEDFGIDTMTEIINEIYDI